MEMYRFRSLESLLGKRQELENQQIYFAPYDDLNDPLEGTTDMIWQGDLIVWSNLLRHYILCLNYMFAIATISTPDEFFCEEIPILMNEENLKINYHNVFNEVKKNFFKDKSVIELLKYLSKRRIGIRDHELSFHLKSIQRVALYIIVSVYVDHGLYRDDSGLLSILKNDTKSNNNRFHLSTLITEDADKIDQFYMSCNLLYHQLNLINMHNAKADKATPWTYLAIDFPEDYVAHVSELVYNKWYTACFMSSCTDASIWGSYGSNHTGICLIYEPRESNARMCLHLKRAMKDEEYRIYDKHPLTMPFEQVTYGAERTQVDFFRSLFTQPEPVLIENWYTDDNKNLSICGDVLKLLDNEMRENYWNNLARISTTKTVDWAYENEYRMVLSPMSTDFADPKSRVFQYDFSDLKGLIFGMKTPIERKLEVINIIKRKCDFYKRTQFKFYQAGYNHYENKMSIDELTLIKISQ